jgi:hypothetical protein
MTNDQTPMTNEERSMIMPTYELSTAVVEDLAKRFTYHKPKDDQPQRYEQIRDLARAFAASLATKCPQSRELSLALTKLEECMMWANASIARNE